MQKERANWRAALSHSALILVHQQQQQHTAQGRTDVEIRALHIKSTGLRTHSWDTPVQCSSESPLLCNALWCPKALHMITLLLARARVLSLQCVCERKQANTDKLTENKLCTQCFGMELCESVQIFPPLISSLFIWFPGKPVCEYVSQRALAGKIS